MKFTHYKLGWKERGAVVEITLRGNAANVRLLDEPNFNAYRAGRKHRYHGGHATKSPVRLAIPRSGQWHVVVDLGGFRGSVRSSIRSLPGQLPPIQHTGTPPLASLVQDLATAEDAEAGGHEEPYDVFISYATEDQDEVVRPLANFLQDAGLRVWYSEFQLRIGDSLRRKIDNGVANSRFGVVVLSKNFFAKNWPQYELDGLVTKEVSGEQRILPLWHKISKDEVMKRSPSLADKLARSTADFTIQEIAAEIADVVQEGT